MANLPESFLLESILAERCMLPGRTLSQTVNQARWLAGDNLETNPITIKPETRSHVAEQLSWVPSPSCSLPGCPFPVKSLTLSAHVTPWMIHFWVIDKSPLLGPRWGSPFLSTLPDPLKVKEYQRKGGHWNWEGPCGGFPGTKTPCVPHVLVLEKALIASNPSLSSKK